MGRPVTATRERILPAAYARFAGYGFRRTSMEDIAAAAGVSRAALYLQFRNKEAIFRSLSEELHARALAEATAALAGDAPLAERLRAGIEARSLRFVEIAYGSPHGAELLDESNRLCGDLAAGARQAMAQIGRHGAAARSQRELVDGARERAMQLGGVQLEVLRVRRGNVVLAVVMAGQWAATLVGFAIANN